ncbi:MAG: hypothetical protein ABSA79_08965 [Candidatus Bathyarchaeia archaeon]|jgi:hypothetical protein
MAVLECPSCNEILEIEPPDRRHSTLISAKPIPKNFHGKIIQKKVRCKNQDCKKTITVYWYAPLEYFCRM